MLCNAYFMWNFFFNLTTVLSPTWLSLAIALKDFTKYVSS